MDRGRHPIVGTVCVALAASVGLLVTGCSTYTDRLLTTNQAAATGDYVSAIGSLNEILGVDTAAEMPVKRGADRTLALLERGTLLQSLGDYASAARDLSAAEADIELIDLTLDPVRSLGAYIYSDSSKPYAALPSERLALNPINLLNYLARDDLSGAAVEARRFQAMRDYLASEEIDDHGVAALGAYLSGFVFEQLGEADRALRYYEEALSRAPLASLQRPVAALAAVAPYRGPMIETLLAERHGKDPFGADGEVLVVLALGRVAHKVPERIPVGVAVGIAGAYITNDVDWLTYGVGKVVVYPELVATPSRLGQPTVRVADGDAPVELLVDLDAAVRREYEELKPKIVAAALTRMATRAAVAEGMRQVGRQESSLLGDVLALLFEGALVATDRPDTRSWTMMPARIFVSRVVLPPGLHEVSIEFSGAPEATRRVQVEVPERGFAAVVVSEPR